eukprot:scaffold795_cov187-Amphora_coffeaeformis.AAC.15
MLCHGLGLSCQELVDSLQVTGTSFHLDFDLGLQFLSLRSHLSFQLSDAGPKSLAITSHVPICGGKCLTFLVTVAHANNAKKLLKYDLVVHDDRELTLSEEREKGEDFFCAA